MIALLPPCPLSPSALAPSLPLPSAALSRSATVSLTPVVSDLWAAAPGLAWSGLVWSGLVCVEPGQASPRWTGAGYNTWRGNKRCRRAARSARRHHRPLSAPPARRRPAATQLHSTRIIDVPCGSTTQIWHDRICDYDSAGEGAVREGAR